jgi:hypothetical protein
MHARTRAHAYRTTFWDAALLLAAEPSSADGEPSSAILWSCCFLLEEVELLTKMNAPTPEICMRVYMYKYSYMYAYMYMYIYVYT